ncbi:hypothetical protein FGG08_004020 [Glutinoglossum americanum]|uniref:Uncharacterized protein n=1 Tax=Glutinoglossum americanum TaxID=1670608 RepID=A0A9P8I342_9PEZI|nr:hypothetical protein FGG08_004020 [Glutinoglossum americanum]
MSSAGAYRAHVSRVHRLSKAYTPNTSSSPLPPPPNYLVDDISGEDVHALLRDYAFIPPSQDMSLMFVKYPYPPPIQRLIDNGGYGRLGSQKGGSANSVLFSVYGTQPTTERVRKAISLDGRERSLPWALVSLARAGEEIFDSTRNAHEKHDKFGQASKVRRVADHRESRLADVRRTPSPWLVRLYDELEAKRFVRAWNQRAFPISFDSSASDEPPSIVKAELVW